MSAQTGSHRLEQPPNVLPAFPMRGAAPGRSPRSAADCSDRSGFIRGAGA